MSPPTEQQQSSNEYDNEVFDNITDDEMPELEDYNIDYTPYYTYHIENPLQIGNSDSYYRSIWNYNEVQTYVDQNNMTYNPNPSEETVDDNQDYDDDMPELENDQNVIFSDSFMDNVEVNDNILDIGINFDFLVETN
jgi:hypothetical protein